MKRPGYRRAVLQALVERGFMPSERWASDKHTKSNRTNSITVTIAVLRRRGFEVETQWGVGYRMKPAERERLAASDSFARGTGYEVAGNAEYVVILKAGKPQTIRRNVFPGMIISQRREHSRKPPQLQDEIERRLAGPYAEVFAREARPGWEVFGNETAKFQGAAA